MAATGGATQSLSVWSLGDDDVGGGAAGTEPFVGSGADLRELLCIFGGEREFVYDAA